MAAMFGGCRDDVDDAAAADPLFAVAALPPAARPLERFDSSSCSFFHSSSRSRSRFFSLQERNKVSTNTIYLDSQMCFTIIILNILLPFRLVARS